jgi:outer membrane biosynthesis protein TonB
MFGRYDPNRELVLYAEAWAKRIEMNMPVELVRQAAKQRYTDPVVNVAIRSDGSIESVTVVRTSGVAAIDEAIPRMVLGMVHLPFTPAMSRQYDVIEIRRSWHFDVAVRLY